MIISSPVFEHNQKMPSKYTCDGKNINPPLRFSEVPEKAKSLILIIDDPDASMGTWVHWLIWNIEPAIIEIQENSVPIGAKEGITSFGKPGYGGPCPPSGTHRYFFKLYALDAKLDLDKSIEKEDLEQAMKGHILEKAELVGLYART